MRVKLRMTVEKCGNRIECKVNVSVMNKGLCGLGMQSEWTKREVYGKCMRQVSMVEEVVGAQRRHSTTKYTKYFKTLFIYNIL